MAATPIYLTNQGVSLHPQPGTPPPPACVRACGEEVEAIAKDAQAVGPVCLVHPRALSTLRKRAGQLALAPTRASLAACTAKKYKSQVPSDEQPRYHHRRRKWHHPRRSTVCWASERHTGAPPLSPPVLHPRHTTPSPSPVTTLPPTFLRPWLACSNRSCGAKAGRTAVSTRRFSCGWLGARACRAPGGSVGSSVACQCGAG